MDKLKKNEEEALQLDRKESILFKEKENLNIINSRNSNNSNAHNLNTNNNNNNKDINNINKEIIGYSLAIKDNKDNNNKDINYKQYRSIYSEGNKDNWIKEKSQISAIKNILLGDKELPEESEIDLNLNLNSKSNK